MKFEIPYNFEPDFVERLFEFRDSFSDIECIYLPAWKDDCDNTRYDITFRDTYPKTYEDYLCRIEELKRTGIPLCILMQKGATEEGFIKYYDIGIRRFIMNDDKLVLGLKEQYPDVKIILSTTRVLTEKQIKEGDFSMYDGIVLFYWFNRNLDAVLRLPDKYNYIIMANNDCYFDCKWHDSHWFSKGKNEYEYIQNVAPSCEKCAERIKDERDRAVIVPEDLSFFAPKISCVKLVDRIWPTYKIMDNLKRYLHPRESPSHDRDYYNIHN